MLRDLCKEYACKLDVPGELLRHLKEEPEKISVWYELSEENPELGEVANVGM